MPSKDTTLWERDGETGTGYRFTRNGEEVARFKTADDMANYYCWLNDEYTRLRNAVPSTHEQLMEAEHRSVPLGDELDILREQFKAACERAEAWKTLALAVREEYGKATTLLGEAAGYLFTFGTYHKQGKGLPERAYDEALDVDRRITECMKAAKVRIPAIIKGEVP